MYFILDSVENLRFQFNFFKFGVWITANQNTGKPLYIRRCSTQPSHRALWSYSRRNLVSIFSMAWYKIVTQHFLVVYYGISHLSLVFSSYTHSPKGSCVYRENTSDSWDIPQYTTRKRCITSMYAYSKTMSLHIIGGCYKLKTNF